MNLWSQWFVLSCAWLCNYVVLHIWPDRQQLLLQSWKDWLGIMIVMPYQFLILLSSMLAFCILAVFLLRKVIRECRIAVVLRKIPWEAMLLFIVLSWLYVRILLLHGLLVVAMTGAVILAFTYFNQSSGKMTSVGTTN